MAAPSRVYLRTLSSSNRKLAKLGERIAGGGAGNIYRLPDRAGEVLKIYKTEKDRGLYAPKLDAGNRFRRLGFIGTHAAKKNASGNWPSGILRLPCNRYV